MSEPTNTLPKRAGPDGTRPPGVGRNGMKPPGGSRKGIPNKSTQTFRETITKLLADNADNVALWLQQTAEGQKARKVGGKTVPGRPPNPEGAAKLLGNLAEFAAPRLSRAEVTGDGGGPLTVVINRSSRKPQEPTDDPA